MTHELLEELVEQMNAATAAVWGPPEDRDWGPPEGLRGWDLEGQTERRPDGYLALRLQETRLLPQPPWMWQRSFDWRMPPVTPEQMPVEPDASWPLTFVSKLPDGR